MPRDRRVSTGGKGTKGNPSPPSFWSLTALRHTMARVVRLRGTFLIPSSLRRSNPPLLRAPNSRAKPAKEAEIVTAKAEDIVQLPNEVVDGKENLAIASRKTNFDDLPELDQDMIRTLIIEAMATNEADQQIVASIAPRTVPKADKPQLDELAELIAQDEAQRQADQASATGKIHQIPELVFVSGLQKNKKQSTMAQLDGRAINFPPVARVSVYD